MPSKMIETIPLNKVRRDFLVNHGYRPDLRILSTPRARVTYAGSSRFSER